MGSSTRMTSIVRSSTVALVIGFLSLAISCASFNSSVFKAEYAATTAADHAMQVWAQFFDKAIMHPQDYGTTGTNLWQARANIDAMAVRYSAAVKTLDAMREMYASKGIDQKPVRAALEDLTLKADELIGLILSVLPKSEAGTIKTL